MNRFLRFCVQVKIVVAEVAGVILFLAVIFAAVRHEIQIVLK